MNAYLVLLVLIVVFGLIALRNFYVGMRRMRMQQHQGDRAMWLKQSNLLLSIACLLIVLVLVIDTSFQNMAHHSLAGLVIEVVIAAVAFFFAWRSFQLRRAENR